MQPRPVDLTELDARFVVVIDAMIAVGELLCEADRHGGEAFVRRTGIQWVDMVSMVAQAPGVLDSTFGDLAHRTPNDNAGVGWVPVAEDPDTTPVAGHFGRALGADDES